ncbi:Dienelactone hydrolase [Singulisphaera sp. GP187]|uniref:dienelactone hydrolase family protein n=1 Tax=Singulisphaera sp. GP187 TaxID=1882752 RepID=UPI00092A590D|nr:dienelactone hydrolase family protein [Singulisphaera sp. GP187]SIO35504.1 Dienelactone hydrolase [Singulisphaera sp. GP187]
MSPSRRRSFPWYLALAAVTVVTTLGPQARAQGLSYSVDGTSYTMQRSPKLSGATKRPVVVLLHGIDGLSDFSRPQIEGFARELEAQGYAVFLPTYFDASDGDLGSLSAPITSVVTTRIARVGEYGKRVAEAVRVARAEMDVDSARVAIVGFSLGGGLALEQAEASSGGVKAVVDFFGHIGSPAILTNAGKLPPTLVFHNHADEIVSASNSKNLMDKLDKTNVIHDVHFLNDEEGVKHHPFKPNGEADQIVCVR